MIRAAALVLVLLVPCLSWASAVPAVKAPEREVSVGPSVGFTGGDIQGVAWGIDTAWTTTMRLPWRGLKPVVSASLNLTSIDAQDGRVLGAALEITTWALVNLGGGVGYLWGPGGGPVSHTFIGIPWILGGDVHVGPFGTLFVEPYHRYHLLSGGVGGARSFHEFGVLLKVSSWQ